MLQKYDVCPEHLSAKLMFRSKLNVFSLYAYGQTVKDLAGVEDEEGETTEEILLQVPMLARVT